MNQQLFWVFGLTTFLLLGCEQDNQDCTPNCTDETSEDQSSDPTSPQDEDNTVSDTENEDPQTNSISTCLPGCNTAADCDAYDGQYPPYDANHYACTNGACRWLGCNTDEECATLAADYVCRELPFTSIQYCLPGCTSAQDCATEAAGSLYGADNYLCDDGACIFSGCNSNEECQEANGSASLCVDPFNLSQNNCYTSCVTNTDCGYPESGPAYDADNYTCTEGLCLYSGCQSDAECAQTQEGMICSND